MTHGESPHRLLKAINCLSGGGGRFHGSQNYTVLALSLAEILFNPFLTMSKEPRKNWANIINSVRGPLSLLALVILAFQVVILALVYRASPESLDTLILATSLIVLLPIIAVSWIVITSGKSLLSSETRLIERAPISVRKVRIFITSPMSTYTDEQYLDVRGEIMKTVSLLRATDSIADVYYFNERYESLEEFENADLSVPEYFNSLDQCDYFVLIVSEAQFSSIHFEAGYAFAKGKKSIYFIRDADCLPFLTRLAAYAYPHIIRTYEYSTYMEIGKVLTNRETYI